MIADEPGLYFLAAVKRASRMELIASAAFGNARLNNSDAQMFSITSWTMTRMRGLWAESMSLFVPGIKIKSVSLEGNVGAGGFGTSTMCYTRTTRIDVDNLALL